MAILQLSRITHRKGLAEDIPQLAGAELGWVVDERKLYIGNGEIVDGAPVIGNTEILTEFTDVLGLGSTYTYKGSDAGYVVETGPSQTSVLRSMQSKFDDFASVKDFGAYGDSDINGIGTDDTDAINRALYQLFCYEVDLAYNSTNNPQARRSLYFPAGIYKVTGKIKIPPHAKLFGEGLTSSIIKFFQAAVISVTEMEAGERYQVEEVGNNGYGPAGTIFISGSAPASGTTTVRPVPAVVETSNNLHQTGLQINNGNELPNGIEMLSMGVATTESNSLIKLNSVSSSAFGYLGLHGPIVDIADIQVLGDEISAVEVTGAVHDVTMSKLNTSGTTYGLRVEGDTKGLVLENSGLDLHYKGVYVTNPTTDAEDIVDTVRYKIISLDDGIGGAVTNFVDFGAIYNRVGETFTADATGTAGTTGTVISMDAPSPTGIVVSRNIFDNIAHEGVHYENVLFNSTGYNVFYDVANNIGGTAVAPVVNFETDQCISVGDLFEREDESVHSRIKLAGNGGIAIDGSHSIHLGAYERQVGILSSLTAATAVAESVFAFTETAVNSYRVDYSITRDTETRMGRLYISNNGTIVAYNDEYTESGDTGIVLSVVVGTTTTDSEVQFTSTAGNDASMTFSVVRLD